MWWMYHKTCCVVWFASWRVVAGHEAKGGEATRSEARRRAPRDTERDEATRKHTQHNAVRLSASSTNRNTAALHRTQRLAMQHESDITTPCHATQRAQCDLTTTRKRQGGMRRTGTQSETRVGEARRKETRHRNDDARIHAVRREVARSGDT